MTVKTVVEMFKLTKDENVKGQMILVDYAVDGYGVISMNGYKFGKRWTVDVHGESGKLLSETFTTRKAAYEYMKGDEVKVLMVEQELDAYVLFLNSAAHEAAEAITSDGGSDVKMLMDNIEKHYNAMCNDKVVNGYAKMAGFTDNLEMMNAVGYQALEDFQIAVEKRVEAPVAPVEPVSDSVDTTTAASKEEAVGAVLEAVPATVEPLRITAMITRSANGSYSVRVTANDKTIARDNCPAFDVAKSEALKIIDKYKDPKVYSLSDQTGENPANRRRFMVCNAIRFLRKGQKFRLMGMADTFKVISVKGGSVQCYRTHDRKAGVIVLEDEFRPTDIVNTISFSREV